MRSGRAQYVGLSSYNSHRTREAAAILEELGTPCLIHQPSYSMINRWIEEDGLVDTLEDLGIGSIVFSPLAQGMLTDKYLKGVPEQSRAAQGKSLNPEFLSDQNIANIRSLNEIASRRGQTLAQMALAWVLRKGRITTALIGASKPQQVIDCVKALDNLEFSDEELAQIDTYANDANVESLGCFGRTQRARAQAGQIGLTRQTEQCFGGGVGRRACKQLAERANCAKCLRQNRNSLNKRNGTFQ